jgi:hypothetical protein
MNLSRISLETPEKLINHCFDSIFNMFNTKIALFKESSDGYIQVYKKSSQEPIFQASVDDLYSTLGIKMSAHLLEAIQPTQPQKTSLSVTKRFIEVVKRDIDVSSKIEGKNFILNTKLTFIASKVVNLTKPRKQIFNDLVENSDKIFVDKDNELFQIGKRFLHSNYIDASNDIPKDLAVIFGFLYLFSFFCDDYEARLSEINLKAKKDLEWVFTYDSNRRYVFKRLFDNYFKQTIFKNGAIYKKGAAKLIQALHSIYKLAKVDAPDENLYIVESPTKPNLMARLLPLHDKIFEQLSNPNVSSSYTHYWSLISLIRFVEFKHPNFAINLKAKNKKNDLNGQYFMSWWLRNVFIDIRGQEKLLKENSEKAYWGKGFYKEMINKLTDSECVDFITSTLNQPINFHSALSPLKIETGDFLPELLNIVGNNYDVVTDDEGNIINFSSLTDFNNNTLSNGYQLTPLQVEKLEENNVIVSVVNDVQEIDFYEYRLNMAINIDNDKKQIKLKDIPDNMSWQYLSDIATMQNFFYFGALYNIEPFHNAYQQFHNKEQTLCNLDNVLKTLIKARKITEVRLIINTEVMAEFNKTHVYFTKFFSEELSYTHYTANSFFYHVKNTDVMVNNINEETPYNKIISNKFKKRLNLNKTKNGEEVYSFSIKNGKEFNKIIISENNKALPSFLKMFIDTPHTLSFSFDKKTKRDEGSENDLMITNQQVRQKK